MMGEPAAGRAGEVENLTSDRVRLKNMVFYGYHGAFQAEKELGHRLEVDVELRTDLEKAARSDELEFSTNCAEIYATVREIIEEDQYSLLESIARAIACRLIEAYDVEEVHVWVRKPLAPLGGLVDSIEVDICRSRKDLAALEEQ